MLDYKKCYDRAEIELEVINTILKFVFLAFWSRSLNYNESLILQEIFQRNFFNGWNLISIHFCLTIIVQENKGFA